MSQLREGKEMDNDNAHNGWPGDGGIARSGFRLGGLLWTDGGRY